MGTFRVDSMLEALSDLEAFAAVSFLRSGEHEVLELPDYLARIPEAEAAETEVQETKSDVKKTQKKVARDPKFAAVTKVN